MKKSFLAIVTVLALFATSCTRTGPQGPQGAPGNANVISSAAFPVSIWTYDAPSNSYYADFTLSDLTQDVQDYGVFEVYKEYSNGWTNLPDINGYIATVYNFRTGGFTISVMNTNGTYTANPGTVYFRTVVIPRAYKQAHPNVNWNDYQQAMAEVAKCNVTKANVVSNTQ